MIPIDKLIGPANVGSASKWAVAPALPTLAFGQRFKAPVKDSPDLQRILALPRRMPPNAQQSADLIEAMTAQYRKKNSRCNCQRVHKRPCLDTLRRVQAWGLYEMQYAKGLIGSINVGHGKTLLGLLAPFALGLKPGQIAVMVCPPSNVGEIVAEYKLASQHFHMPSITTHGRIDFTCPVRGAPSLHVLPYSLLQRPEYEKWISTIKPVAIIADETDKLRDPEKSATSARIIRHFETYPSTYFCGWTGSLTDTTIEDYRHLLGIAFGASSPCPLDKFVTKDWGRALNPSPYPCPGGALLQLCDPGEEVRSGYRRRLSETLGVIITTESSIDAPIIITERKVASVPDVIRDALELCRKGVRPDGEELVTPLAITACAKEIACGFHYKWIYPRNEPHDLRDLWFERRKAWGKELRKALVGRPEGKDSDKLCTDAAKRYLGILSCKRCDPITQFLCTHCEGTGKDTSGPVWQSAHLVPWLEVADLVKPDQAAVRLHDYLVQDSAEWGLQNKGIIWYSHSEFGRWVSELSGFNLHTGGPNARELILAETGDKTVVVSLESHGRGRDGLQFAFHKNLVVVPPASATKNEQLLGRTARPGQKEDPVYAEYYLHTKELVGAYDKAKVRAEYFVETLGSPQRIL